MGLIKKAVCWLQINVCVQILVNPDSNLDTNDSNKKMDFGKICVAVVAMYKF